MGILNRLKLNGLLEIDIINKINDVELPKDYIEFMKEHNGGGELFGIDINQNYFTVPTIMDEEDKIILGKTLIEFLENINKYFEC